VVLWLLLWLVRMFKRLFELKGWRLLFERNARAFF